MFRSMWIHKLLGWTHSRSVRRRQASQQEKRRLVRPQLEMLEDRVTPTTTVSAANATQLSSAFSAANTAQTAYVINLTGTSADYNFNTIGSQLVDMDKAGISVVGTGQTLTAASNNRLFQVNNGASLSLKDVTLTGGNVSSTTAAGGAIKAAGGDVTLSDATITANSVHGSKEAYGGGIYVSGGGSLSVTNSHIDGNQAFGSTAKIASAGSASGGGVFVTGGGTVTITGSTISNDLAHGGNGTNAGGSAHGGGMDVEGDHGINPPSGSMVSISGTTFTSDRAVGGTPTAKGAHDGGSAYGGALQVDGTSFNVTITSSTLTSNKAAGGTGATGTSNGGNGGDGGYAAGGGVYVFGSGSVSITSSTFGGTNAGNTAQGGKGGNGGAKGGAGGRGSEATGGGAYLDFTGSLDVSTSSFDNNTAAGGDGGTGGTGKAGHTGGAGGDGYYGGAGGMYVVATSATFTSTSFSSNTAKGGNGGAGGAGGASISAAGGNGGSGGYAYYGWAGGLYTDTSTLTILDSGFNANVVITGTGGKGGQGGNGTKGGTGGNGGNASYGYAGGAWLFGETDSITNSSFTNNSNTAGTGGQGGTGGVGSTGKGGGGGNGGRALDAYAGGLYLESTTATIINTTVGANTATGGTAGAKGLGGTGKTGPGANGSAGTAGSAFGGGLYGSDAWTMINDTIANNKAVGGTGGATTVTAQGGGIYNFDDPKLTNVILEGNTALKGPDYYGSVSVAGSSFDFISNTSGIFNAGTAGPPPTGLFAQPGMILNNQTPQLGALATATTATDPLAPPDGLDYYAPLPKSIIIDAGTNGVLSTIASAENVSVADATDEIGNARLDAGTGIIDIGAIEFSPAFSATTTTVKDVTITQSASPTPVILTADVGVTGSSQLISEGTVTFTVTGGTLNLTIPGVSVVNGVAATTPNQVVIPGNQAVGSYTITAAYSDPTGVFQNSTGTGTLNVTAVAVVPLVTLNPVSQMVSAGSTVLFSATASGTPTPTVQWMVSTDGGATFSPISGATTTTLSLPSVSTTMNGNEYEAVFTNSSGTATTTAALLTVTSPPPPPPPSPPTPTSAQQAAFAVAIDTAAILLQGNAGALLQLNVIDEAILGHGLPSDLLSDFLFNLPFADGMAAAAIQAGINFAHSFH